MPSQDPAVLLEAEHAVACVLAQGPRLPGLYPRLLEAIGTALRWEFAAAWEVGDDDVMDCVATWCSPGIAGERFAAATRGVRLARGAGLPGRVWARGRPVRIADVTSDPNFPRAPAAERAGLRCGVCFPVRGAGGVLGAIELFACGPQGSDRALLQAMGTLGRQIGQAVERARAEQALRESIARKSAILDAAFDCVITMDADGNVVEVNRATERTFGYRAEAMVGRELAELIVPPDLREAHRRGVRRYVQTGEGRALDHPLELTGQRADGSIFPVEIAITRPQLDGPPLFTGYLRDVTERRRADAELRALAVEQAALRRVATMVASESDPQRVFSAVTEEVGRLLGADAANLNRYDEDRPSATVVGGWSARGREVVDSGASIPLDGDTASARVYRTGGPARVDTYDGMAGGVAERVRSLGFRCAVAAPITLAGRLWGVVVVFSTRIGAFAPGDEQRIAAFAELAAQALANAEAREQLAASRARIVEAGDAERRRLERNLHDGAQQRLVGLALTLRLAERRLDDPDAVRELLGRAGTELGQALDELRELARGLHPAVLTDRGLGPALETLASRAPVPVEVAGAVDERLPAGVEAAAYFVVSEALANVAKYARASAVRVDVERSDGQVTVTVADDGVGGADAARGSGLRGLTDRVEALGGRLEIRSPPGAGTTLRARLPYAGAPAR